MIFMNFTTIVKQLSLLNAAKVYNFNDQMLSIWTIKIKTVQGASSICRYEHALLVNM